MHAAVHDLEQARHQQDVFLDVLDRAMSAVRGTAEPVALIGELASAAFGRDRGTRDIDLFMRPASAPVVLDALDDAGFDVEVVDDHWLYKARMLGIDVDVIFRATRDILFDDDVAARVRDVPIYGRSLPVVAAEDLLVMKALAAGEDTARYWYDAIAILARQDLDWDYLMLRARQNGARRICSLLLFATSVDVLVPRRAIDGLYELIQGGSDVD
ncbi:MAG TPA: nucleotidyltransferase [Actinomycetota bacterium]|nr:nucleotidyltransferase [Actinomycetota bacterium]